MSGRALAGLIAIACVACASPVGPPLVVPLDRNEWGGYTLLVYDDSGLVTAARSAQWQPGTASDELIAFPERQELEVGWTGGACSHRPTLKVTGDSSALRLTVGNPNDPQPLPFLPIACPAVGVPLRVALSLSEPVAQNAVGIEVVY